MRARLLAGRRVPSVSAKAIPIGEPAAALGAVYAWRADDVTYATTTSKWNPYVGAVPLATVLGVQQAAPAVDAALGNKLSVAFAGTGSYNGAIASLGTAQTILWVGRSSAANGAFANFGDGTATSNFVGMNGFAGTTYLQRTGVYSQFAQAQPYAGVFLATATTAGGSIYYNSGTPSGVSSTASSSPAAYSTMYLGSQSAPTLVLPLTGAVARLIVWNRVLSALEIVHAMKWACSNYGQVFTP